MTRLELIKAFLAYVESHDVSFHGSHTDREHSADYKKCDYEDCIERTRLVRAAKKIIKGSR